MVYFDCYPQRGRQLLGINRGANCRHGYGLELMRRIGQTACAYCGMDFAASYENWLQMAVDHVVPTSVCKRMSLPVEWYEDCTNKVLACAACNGFDNRYKQAQAEECPLTLDAFYAMRDRIFMERSKRIAERHRLERDFFGQRLWERETS